MRRRPSSSPPSGDMFPVWGSRRGLLTAEEERTLARRIGRGDVSASREMVEANLGLAVCIALRYRGNGLELADLVQEGVIGLGVATRRFDVSRGVRFATFAGWWIHGSIQEAIIRTGRAIRRPPRVERNLRRLTRARDALEPGVGREASVTELAEATGIPEPEVVEALAVPSHHPLEHAELIPDAVAPDALETAARHERQAVVREAVSLLPDLERRVLELRFGFDGPRCSLDECGRALGFGRARAQTLETAALASLARHLADRASS